MKSAKSGVLKRVLKQLKGYRLWLTATIFCALIAVAGTLAVPVFFGEIINLIVGEGNVNFGSLLSGHIYTKFLLITGCIALTSIAQWLMNVINNHITYNVIKDVREEAFANIQRLPLKYIDSHSYGDIVSRNIADVDQFADGLLMGFTQLFTGVLTIIGTLVMMLVINWAIALVVVVITPLSLFVAKFIASRTYSLFKRLLR